MGVNGGGYFVEWKEEFVSQERGSRIVHYILKDCNGTSVLAVVGTERSLRHMVYVVSDDFLSYSNSDSPVQAGFKWRSRREVVDWLTSMLAKQPQISDSSRGDTTESLRSPELLTAQHLFADKMDHHRVRNSRQSFSDVVWLGGSWTCGKQLKHFPAFCRNGTTIAAQSFVFVMAKEENRYVAYLDDMFEDKKGQKKVKVRWFHQSQEVKGIVRLRNAHPKEVYITPYTQVISVECVDGPAIVLNREHFNKCVASFPEGLLGKVHLCFRQFRSNKIKPFDLSKMKGYFQQPIISCLESNTFPNSDSMCCDLVGDGIKAFKSGENTGKVLKRKRSSGDQESFLTAHLDAKGNRRKKIGTGNYDAFDKRVLPFKNAEWQRLHAQLFKVDDKIELLCQDSGIRGCWFRCTVLEISRKQMKVQYSDVEDQDGCGNLEEWVPAFRLAAVDKLGMRCLGRPTIRPSPPISDPTDTELQIGSPVDAWWSDGWWEGVVTATKNGGFDDFQLYIPGESMFIDIPRKDLRISRDWLGGKWMDVMPKLDILTIIGTKTKSPETKVDGSENDDTELVTQASHDGHAEQVCSPDKKVEGTDDQVNDQSEESDYVNAQVSEQNIGNSNDDDGSKKEGKSGVEDPQNTEMAEANDTTLELKEVAA